MTTTHPIEITCSRDFLEWLWAERIGLAFTTYQTNRLFLLGVKPDGSLSTYERLFDRPMGLFAQQDRLFMGCRYQIWQLDNTLPPGESHEGYDALFVPRRSYTTGDVDVHDVRLDKNGRLIFVNTLYSCLATLNERYSFTPLWQPPFISRLAPEDRCHLNGVAMEDGMPRYATAVSQSDVFSGWRKQRERGGILIDIQSDEILLDDLSMPHSPRLHEERLWLLNAGSGELGWVDREKQSFEAIAFCPGFGRGLVFHKNYAIVGLSKPRRVKAFEGLSLDDKLAAKKANAICGLAVIDLNSGNVTHWVEVEGLVSELYDVAVLPNVRRPMSLGFKSDEINRFVTIAPPTGSPIFQQLKASVDAPAPIDFQAISGTSEQLSVISHAQTPIFQKTTSSPKSSQIRYQISYDMTIAAIREQYAALTFPPIEEQMRGNVIREPLAATVALQGTQVVGLALAEGSPDRQGARLRSCMVAADYRRQGIATQLLASLASGLAQRNIQYLDLVYSTDWASAAVVEHFLQKYGWLPSKTTLHQYKVNMAELSSASWLFDEHAALPEGFEVFPWSELPESERAAIQQKQITENWYPSNLDPFQAEEYLAFNCLGLRYSGEVVGWMVTHQPAADTIQYTSFFLASEQRGNGLGVPLLAAALHKHLESEIPYAIWQVAADNDEMLAFVRQYLQPYLARQSEQRISRKVFARR